MLTESLETIEQVNFNLVNSWGFLQKTRIKSYPTNYVALVLLAYDADARGGSYDGGHAKQACSCCSGPRPALCTFSLCCCFIIVVRFYRFHELNSSFENSALNFQLGLYSRSHLYDKIVKPYSRHQLSLMKNYASLRLILKIFYYDKIFFLS